MKKNIGKNDRILRLVIALILLGGAIWTKSFILFFISLFVFFEAIYGWCLFYQIIGKNSCDIE